MVENHFCLKHLPCACAGFFFVGVYAFAIPAVYVLLNVLGKHYRSSPAVSFRKKTADDKINARHYCDQFWC